MSHSDTSMLNLRLKNLEPLTSSITQTLLVSWVLLLVPKMGFFSPHPFLKFLYVLNPKFSGRPLCLYTLVPVGWWFFLNKHRIQVEHQQRDNDALLESWDTEELTASVISRGLWHSLGCSWAHKTPTQDSQRWHRACRTAVPFWIGSCLISVIKHLTRSLNIALGSLLLQSWLPLFSHYLSPAWPPKTCWVREETLTRVSTEVETGSVKQTRTAKATRSSQRCITDGKHRNIVFSKIC